MSLVNDQKCVAIHSTSRLVNASSVHLDVRLSLPTSSEAETVHPLPPGTTLPLPPRTDGGSVRLCLRPSSGEQDWCAMTHVPATAAEPHPAVTVPLVCAPAVVGASAWHCLLHHSGGASGGVHELTIQPTVELRNLLACPLRFELLGSGVAVGRTLPSGESLRSHAFPQGTAISFSMAIAGYSPSDRQLVAAPPNYDDEVLCRSGVSRPHRPYTGGESPQAPVDPS